MPTSAMVTNHTTITGPNSLPTRSRAALLNDEQANQDRDGYRHHPPREHRRRDRQPFDGAEDTDRRRDHAFAVEQRCAEDAEQR